MNKNEPIDLNAKRAALQKTAEEMYARITGLPADVRNDDKQRTGIQFLLWEPGTRNLIIGSVGSPSEAAQFFAIEKAVRASENGEATSQESDDPEKMKFAGSVGMPVGKSKFFASVSGLQAAEDVVVAIKLLSTATDLSVSEIVDTVYTPDGVEEEGSYLRDLLDLNEVKA